MQLALIVHAYKGWAEVQALAHNCGTPLRSSPAPAPSAHTCFPASLSAPTSCLRTSTAIMARGVPVSVLEFEVSPAEAVKRFNDYQRTACMGFHAPSLLHLPKLQLVNEPPATAKPPAASASGSSKQHAAWAGPGAAASTGSNQGPRDGGSSGGKEPTSLTAAYLPFWCFELEYSSEARAQLGFKDERWGGGGGRCMAKECLEELATRLGAWRAVTQRPAGADALLRQQRSMSMCWRLWAQRWR